MKPASLFITVLFVALLAGPAFARADAFFQSVSDIPLMPGLSEITDQEVVFDKPEGRIVEAAASTSRNRDAILSFYDSTLPQLGWDKTGAGTFVRSGETLKIGIEDAGGGRLVHIAILPRS